MRYTIIILFTLICFRSMSQSLSAKSNELIVDFSDPRKDNSVSMSNINWTSPTDSVTYLKEGVIQISIQVKSMYGLLAAKLRVKDIKTNKFVNEFKIIVEESTKNDLRIDRTLTLPEGEMEIDIIAENLEGFSVRSSRVAIVQKKK